MPIVLMAESRWKGGDKVWQRNKIRTKIQTSRRQGIKQDNTTCLEKDCCFSWRCIYNNLNICYNHIVFAYNSFGLITCFTSLF